MTRLAVIAATIVILVAGVASLGHRNPNTAPTQATVTAPPVASAVELRTERRPSRSRPVRARTQAPVPRAATPSAAPGKDGARGSSRPVSAEGKPRHRAGGTPDVWQRLAACESRGRLRAVGGPGGIYRGLYQIHVGWYAGADMDPATATAADQLALARKILAKQGPGAWPVCGPRAGLVRGA